MKYARLGAIFLCTTVLLSSVVWLSACATSHNPDQPNTDRPLVSIYDIPPAELVTMSDRELLKRVGVLAEDNLSSLELIANSTGRGGYFPNVKALKRKQDRLLAERDRLVSEYQQKDCSTSESATICH